jgi:hypothetical protein
MSNTISNLKMHDLKPSNYKLDVEKFMERKDKQENSTLRVLSLDDAASVEISQLARAMYEAREATPATPTAEAENAAEAETDETAATETVTANQEEETAATETVTQKDSLYTAFKAQNDYSNYDGLSSAQKEQKELEDYVAYINANTEKTDLLRDNTSITANGGEPVNVNSPLVKAESEYGEVFNYATADFADFGGKITMGAYDENDVSIDDINLDAVDKLNSLYDSYKEKINSEYDGDERTQYLDALDRQYNEAFERNILKPIKNAYDLKLYYNKPDSEETMSSIQVASTDKSRLEDMVSNYFANQSMKQKYTDILTEGTQSFYDLAADKSMWHNTEAVRTALTDSMNVYSSVTEYKIDSAEYSSAKAAADAAAKKISDAYAQQLAYRGDMLGFKVNGTDTEYGADAAKSINDYINSTSSGMFVLDFSKIEDLSSYYKFN